jgi:uncharacterized protein
MANQIVAAAGVAPRTADGRLLFLKRQGGDYAGHWCFPGGGIEDGENAAQAARRETMEETGHDLDQPFRDLSRMIAHGVDYTTHIADIADPFPVELNDEHSEYVWAQPDAAPEPLHPGVKALIAGSVDEDWALPQLTAADAAIAFDRASVRTKDQDGRLHVAVTHISKANVCPYGGWEIPGWRKLGLDPDKTYHLYRDPDELAKAAPTFNNIPVLSEHVAVGAQDHRPELVIGSTGTDGAFASPYLNNSMVIWAGRSIQDIEAEVSCEISSAYYYTPDMTPGEADGVPFDGVMRDIIANHVAIVPEGRAGPDVIVGDSKKEDEPMTTVKLSRKAVQVRGALIAYFAPKLAADAKINLSAPLLGMDAKNFTDKKAAIVASLKASTAGKLAADASVEDLTDLLDKLDDPSLVDMTAADENDMDDVDQPAGDADPIDAAKDFLKGLLSPEDFAKLETMLAGTAVPPAADSEHDDEDTPKPITQTAMDAAIASAVKRAKSEAAQEQVEIAGALRTVRPWVGELAMSFDSAEGVLRHTLGLLGVTKASTIHPSALEDVLLAQPKPGARVANPAPAMDAAAAKSYADRFPNAARVRTF